MAFFKQIIALCLVFSFMTGFGISSINSSATVVEIDNDDASANYYSVYSPAKWTYLSGNSNFRGDARVYSSYTLISGSKVASVHDWEFTSHKSFTTGKVNSFKVYLNSSSFNDTKVTYKAIVGLGYCTLGTYNQNSAPSGWSYVTSAADKTLTAVAGDSKSLCGFSLWGSTISSSTNVGADGIIVSYTLN